MISKWYIGLGLVLALTASSRSVEANPYGSVRSLHIRESGVLRTTPTTNLPVNGDATFRVMLRRNEWDLGRRTLMALTDGTTVRLSINYNLSPWIYPYVDNGSALRPVRIGEEISVIFGCPTGQVYEDWWVVYKAPGMSGGADGYLQVYRNGAPAPLDLSGTVARKTIPAGTALTWQGGPLYLQIGDHSSGPRQNFHLLDIAWWTKALSSSEIAAIGDQQIASITDNTIRHLDSLFWYARPGNAYLDRVKPELGAAVGRPELEAVISGNVSFSTNVPTRAGWEIPDDITPPDPGSDALSASSTDTSINVSMGAGSADTTHREIILSRSAVSRYTVVNRRDIASSGDTAAVAFSDLTPGKHYFVTARWRDASGNVAERQVEIVTKGTEPSSSGPTRSLRIRQDGIAYTQVEGVDGERQFVELPFNVDGATVRVVVRRNAGFTGPAWFWSSRADHAAEYGYTRFALGQSAHGKPMAKVTDGELKFTAEAAEPLPIGEFTELWMTYEAPSPSTPGTLKLFRNVGKSLVLLASTPLPATDFTWRKWDSIFVLGGLQDGLPNSTIDYNMLETAFWMKALTPSEMQALIGRGLHGATYEERIGRFLYWYARPHPDDDRIVPDLGASIGTAPLRNATEDVAESGIIAPRIPDAMVDKVLFSEEVPASYNVVGPLEYTYADASRALQITAGMEPSSATSAAWLDVHTGSQPGVVTLEDAVAILRIVSGLESSP